MLSRSEDKVATRIAELLDEEGGSRFLDHVDFTRLGISPRVLRQMLANFERQGLIKVVDRTDERGEDPSTRMIEVPEKSQRWFARHAR
jgi:Mn-dependent DtxR family transcriptional regulator